MYDLPLLLLVIILPQIKVYLSDTNNVNPLLSRRLEKLFTGRIQGAFEGLSQAVLKLFAPTTDEKNAGLEYGESISTNEFFI